MKASYDLFNNYEILRYNERLKSYDKISNEEALSVRNNGYIAPVASGYYQAKSILIGVIKDDTIVYYKALKK